MKFVGQLHGTVVNTHDANMHPESSNGTFRPTAGLDAVRCDYVVASLNVTVVPRSCQIDLRFLRHANGDDHLPMKVTVVLPGTARHAITKRCSLPYSRAAILQDMKTGHLVKSERRERVANKINAIPLSLVTMDVSSQTFAYASSVVNVLEQEYPPDEKVQRQHWLSTATYQLSQQRSKVCNHL